MPPGRQYQYCIALYCCTRVLLYSQVLKETETEEAIEVLMSHFYHWWHFNWENTGSLPPFPATPMLSHLSFSGQA